MTGPCSRPDDREGYRVFASVSVSSEKTGELESWVMEAAYRSKGIGTILMIRGLARVDTIGIVRKRVPVRDGNEAAWAFYRKSGFFPRITVPE